MGRKFAWSEVEEQAQTIPADIYALEIDSIEESLSKEKSKLMYRVTFRVIEPETYRGHLLFEYYVFGTDEDPLAEKQETLNTSYGIKRFKRMMRAAQIPDLEDMDELIVAALGNKFTASVSQVTDDGSRDPKYKGRMRNEITMVHTYGAQPTGAKVARPGAPKVTAPGSNAKAETMLCTMCNTNVPRSGYVAHVQTHAE